jgi:hypothetical protein
VADKHQKSRSWARTGKHNMDSKKNILTGVGLEPTLSFPNQEITIKVDLNLAP